MRRFVSRRMALVCSVAAVGACAKSEPPADQVVVAPVAAPVVHVEAADYSFKAPDTIPSGPTTFHLMNGGKEIHHVVLIKAPLATVQTMNPAGPPAPEIVVAGGPNAAPPGGTAEATIDLVPGEYTLVCLVPAADGKPHLLHGMMRSLTVTQGASAAVVPVPDMTLKLTDYAFGVADTIAAGHHVIKVDNDGPQMHEIVFVKLEPGKTVGDFLTWSEKLTGPPPASLVHGVSPMTTGQSNTVAVDLAPGDYVMVCFVSDTKDKKPHFLHGMVKAVKVT